MVRKHGKAHTELYRVYDEIATNKGLYLVAYANLSSNTGAMTPGIDREKANPTSDTCPNQG